MILAIDTKAVLYLFDSEDQVVTDFEAIDVENKEYEFCDDAGRRLDAEITKPVTRFRGGAFRLVSYGTPDRDLPIQFFRRARELGRACSGITSLEGLRTLLRIPPSPRQ